jgi:hypothetical protein
MERQDGTFGRKVIISSQFITWQVSLFFSYALQAVLHARGANGHTGRSSISVRTGSLRGTDDQKHFSNEIVIRDLPIITDFFQPVPGVWGHGYHGELFGHEDTIPKRRDCSSILYSEFFRNPENTVSVGVDISFNLLPHR